MVRSVFGRHRSLAFLVLVSLLAVGQACTAALAAPGPEDSIRMLQKGIDTKDKALVTQYLDIDAVVDKAVEKLFTDDDIVREAAQNPAIAVLVALGGNPGTNEALRAMLRDEAREYVLHGVASGAFAGKPDASAAAYRSVFGKVFRGGDKDKKAFGPVKVLQKGNDAALVATTLQHGTKGKQYPLKLRLEKRDAVWQVVAITNAEDLVRKGKNKEAK